MIKLLIVEDEPAILQGVKQLVSELQPVIQISGLCRNGKEALVQMKKDTPDIVLTDIRMPEMDGLQLIKQAKSIYPEVEYVILSGYSEFDYAKTAISLGVNSYILKPPVKKELIQELEKLAQRIHKKQEQKKKKYYQDVMFLGEQMANEVFPVQQGTFFYLILIVIGPYAMHNHNYIVPDGLVWSNDKIGKKLKKHLKENSEVIIYDGNTINEKIILFETKDPGILPVKHVVNQLAEYEKILEMPVNLMLSDQVTDIQMLSDVYNSLRHNMGNQAMIGKTHLGLLKDETVQDSYLAMDKQERKHLQHLLDQEDFHGILELFKHLSEIWQQEKLSQRICEFSAKFIITELYHSYERLQKEYSIEVLHQEIEKVVATSITFQQFTDGICRIIQNLQNEMKKMKQNKTIEDVVNLLEEHINTNYMYPFSIEQFSKQFGYNPTYIANQFTVFKQISPNKKITNLRIEKGKELLLHSSYKLKDIADILGYQDVSYFSRIFKEHSGESPKQFRSNGRASK